MGMIRREIDRIRSELIRGTNERSKEFYAAQQALEWALEPGGIASPYQIITGTREDSEDCFRPPHPLPSSDICFHGD